MAVERRTPSPPLVRPRRRDLETGSATPRSARLLDGGTSGNERLTSVTGPSSRDTWFPIHKLSFFAWLALIAIHVLAHLPEVGRALVADYGRARGAGAAIQWSGAGNGRAGRTIALSGALVLGTVLAILVIPQFGPWLSAHLHHHH